MALGREDAGSYSECHVCVDCLEVLVALNHQFKKCACNAVKFDKKEHTKSRPRLLRMKGLKTFFLNPKNLF